MSGKRKHAQKQPGTKTTVEDTAGKPPQDPPPPEKLKCFQDVLDIVCGLSDEEWRALTSDAPHARSKAEFASLCTSIMISVGKSAVKSFLPTLIHTLGMEAVLTAEDPFQKEVPLNKSNSSENHEASPSSDQRNGRIEDSSHSTPDLKECEGNVLTAKSERFLSKATQVVSDLLVRSDRCSTSTSTGSSKEIHDAAVNIAETVVEALDKLVESSVIDSQSDSEAIIRSLEASTHTLNRSDISEGRVPSTSLFRRVRGYVQALFTSLKPDEQTAASIQEAPVSDLQRSKDHTVSQLDDLTITCTNNIIVGLRKCLGSRPGPSQACRSTSDSVMETWARNLLRDPIQVPLALVYPFVEESVKSLLLHCLSPHAFMKLA
ncbi:hypothetical protein SRHO_G00021710 [Serrasalmus rhombeus]